jgi:hypothetical protein
LKYGRGLSPLFQCQGDDGHGEGVGNRLRLQHRLEVLGVAYKSLHLGHDASVCLNLSGTRITDVTPLTELPLTHLCLQGCYGITDFSPLGQMRLSWLNLCRTRITDLSVLSRTPLSYLDLRGTRTADLRPLANVRLTHLDVRYTRISDVSSLGRMPLESLAFRPNRIREGLHVLEGMCTLKTINRQPTAEFWRRQSATRRNGHSAP